MEDKKLKTTVSITAVTDPAVYDEDISVDEFLTQFVSALKVAAPPGVDFNFETKTETVEEETKH